MGDHRADAGPDRRAASAPLAELTTPIPAISAALADRGYAIRYPVVGGGELYLPWAKAEAKRRSDAQAAGNPISDLDGPVHALGFAAHLGRALSDQDHAERPRRSSCCTSAAPDVVLLPERASNPKDLDRPSTAIRWRYWEVTPWWSTRPR